MPFRGRQWGILPHPLIEESFVWWSGIKWNGGIKHGYKKREIKLSFLGYSVLMPPLGGSVIPVKNQCESQSGPRRCLPSLNVWTGWYGLWVVQSLPSAPCWPNSVELTHPAPLRCSCSLIYSLCLQTASPCPLSHSVQSSYIHVQ